MAWWLVVLETTPPATEDFFASGDAAAAAPDSSAGLSDFPGFWGADFTDASWLDFGSCAESAYEFAPIKKLATKKIDRIKAKLLTTQL